jgi:hypothetical protein
MRLIDKLIATKQWSCWFLMRLLLIVQKEYGKKVLPDSPFVNEQITQTVRLIFEATPWDSKTEDWENLRKGLAIFLLNNREDQTVRKLFVDSLPQKVKDQFIELNQHLKETLELDQV